VPKQVIALGPDRYRLACQRIGAAAATLAGRILVFGGASFSVHDAVQWFHPATGTTSVVGHMPRQRADVTAAVVGAQLPDAPGGARVVLPAFSDTNRLSTLARR